MAFSLLAPPVVSHAEAVGIGAHVCRQIALQPLQLVPLARIADLILSGLSARMAPAAAATLLDRAATPLLLFLPSPLEEIRRVCAAFKRR